MRRPSKGQAPKIGDEGISRIAKDERDPQTKNVNFTMLISWHKDFKAWCLRHELTMLEAVYRGHKALKKEIGE